MLKDRVMFPHHFSLISHLLPLAYMMIGLLLRENEVIGRYYPKNKEYIKGHDVSVLIQSYIKQVKGVIEDFEEE
ncbi:MAG: hypothetical protein JSW11_09345 [Candidatus Heimdallarchaeota archaeon]|nr:MAG: hypothetical protein JSW11_09345 [Candidatus Heimdallarchaeota archaeon]